MLPCGSNPSSAAMQALLPDWAEWDVEHPPPLRAKPRLMLHINSYCFIYNPSAEMCSSYVGQGTHPHSPSLMDQGKASAADFSD